MSQSLHNKDPPHFEDAIQKPEWVLAMNEELSSLEQNNTWELTSLPINKKPIGCKWVYRTKYNADGTLYKHKARLMILGNHQRPGEDYEQTFAPVAKMVTVRSLLALAAVNQWIVHQMDVKNTFLHGDLNEIIYTRLPPSYTKSGDTSNVSSKGEQTRLQFPYVFKLLKSLYGLKQAPQQWFAKLSSALKNDSLIQSKSYYSLFVKPTSKDIVVVLVYGDDLVVVGSNIELINATKVFFQTQFNMKDLGPLRYTLNLLASYNMQTCKPLKLPMNVNLQLRTDTPLPKAEPYQRLIGKLIYLTITRPDIAYTLHVLSKFMHSPTDIVTPRDFNDVIN